MRFIIYDLNGNEEEKGSISSSTEEMTVPTHGSISIETPHGWLNFLTSEWLNVTVAAEPETWED